MVVVETTLGWKATIMCVAMLCVAISSKGEFLHYILHADTEVLVTHDYRHLMEPKRASEGVTWVGGIKQDWDKTECRCGWIWRVPSG